MRPILILTTAIALAASSPALGQSRIQTLLGGAPNGVLATTANLNNPSAAVGDTDGNVYVALRGARQVVRIDTAGMVWLFAGSGSSASSADSDLATAVRLFAPVAVAVEASGNVYIADSESNQIRRVTPDGRISTVAGNGRTGNTGDGGPAIEASFKSPTALAFDVNGNLLIADTGNHVIRMLTLDGRIVRVAGTGSRASGGDDGPALQAGLDSPAGVAADGNGNTYVADTGNNEIRVIRPDGTVERYAGRDQTSSSGPGFGGGGDPNIALNATLSAPTSMTVDGAGNLYFIESGSVRVRRVSTDGRIANYAGTGTRGASGDGGYARSANLNPTGIGLDGRGNLLIADGGNNRVRIVDSATGIIDTLGGNGLVSYDPRGLAANGDVIYFSDGSSNRVRKFNISTGEVALVAGDGQAMFDGDGSSALEASLRNPRGLALDSSGKLYIADSGNDRVRCVDTGGKITTVAGDGTRAVNQDDGALATAATLYEPVDVAVDSSGAVYVVERGGHRVRKFTVGGPITTIAGTGTSGRPSSESGQAISEPLNLPQAIAVEKSGSVLVADTSNHRIRRIGTDGTITTVAGNGTGTYSGDGGPAVSAQLNNPTGVAVDEAGNTFISDTNNNLLRDIATDGTIGTVAGIPSTRAGGFNGDGSPATGYSLSRPGIVVPYSDCTVLAADAVNQRIRRVWPAVLFAIATNPPGLQVMVDGEPVTTPVALGWLPGTSHRVDGPAQEGSPGTRYLGQGGQDTSVSCGSAPATITVPFRIQYSLSVNVTEGGTVTAVDPWQDAAASVALDATPNDGFTFTGWEGDCTGTEQCRLTMDGPKTVKANFAAVSN